MHTARLHLHRRTGLTFLEVVVSMALLVTLSASIFGAVSFMESTNAQNRFRLDATEVAHRLIVQYIDNQASMPPEHEPIQHGDRLYRWVLREEILAQEEQESGLKKRVAKNASQMTAMEQIPEMLNRLTVQVYLDDPADPLSLTKPRATIERIYSPITTGTDDEILVRILKLVERANAESAAQDRRGAGEKK